MVNNALPSLSILVPDGWKDYELLDSGNGRKLERYGPYTLIRPEHRAIWQPGLAEKSWAGAHAEFLPTSDESGGAWHFNRQLDPAWVLGYKGLHFYAQLTNSRHMGFFPEQASLWDWIDDQVRRANRPLRVLNLFAYTGLASLVAARAGALVTHVDASKRSVQTAKENQALSALEDRPVRWIVDDVLKFVAREIRRGSHYDGILLDPPKFGRGPSGQVWEFHQSLPVLLSHCRKLLSPDPCFIAITAYAIQLSSVSIYNVLNETVSGLSGSVNAGELGLIEKSSGRCLVTALFSCWSKDL